MINRIKFYIVRHIMAYLHSHSRVKEFVKRVVLGNKILQKIAFRMLQESSHESKKSTLCNRRAQRAYEALKEGVDH